MERSEQAKIKKMLKELFNEASNGLIKIGVGDSCWRFYSKFYVSVEGNDNTVNKMLPTVQIPNLEMFMKVLNNYLQTAREFYKKDQDYYGLDDYSFDKFLTLNLVVNAGMYDFYDFTRYVKQRSSMLQEKEVVGHIGFGEYKDFYASAEIDKLHCNLEAPYRFTTSIRDKDGGEFVLPSVVYGIDGDVAHIYAIQGRNGKQKSKVANSMDRYFRKLNKGVEEYVGEDSELLQVSPNALASITIFNSYLKSKGITKIIATEFMPVRYQSNKSAIYVRGAAKSESSEDIKKNIEKHDFVQHNITEKFMYTLMRYCYHFDDSEFDYDDICHKMKIKLNNQHQKTDNIIFELEDLVLDSKQTLVK